MNPKFFIGQRVHWFEYYSDMIVKNGGYGTIVDIEIAVGSGEISSFYVYVILKDGGQLEKYVENDLEEIDWLEEDNESEEE